MSNLHAPGLAPHSIDDHDPPADAANCWRYCPELMPTVAEDPADDDDLERLLEGLRGL